MIKEFVVQRRTTQKCARFRCSRQVKSFYRVLQLFCLSLVLLNTACSTLNSSSYDREYTRESSAFAIAAQDPNTWQPVVAALVIAASDTDHDISRWATDHNPLFGSDNSAQDASDFLRGTLAATAVVTSLVAPGKDDVLIPGRTGNIAIAGTAAYVNGKITHWLKDETGRIRPRGESNQSFPSSHTAAASTYATVSSYRINELRISEKQRKAWNFGFHALAAATGWARVEAKAHYPTDVLVGYALGNFTTVWLHEVFQSPQESIRFNIYLDRKNDAFNLDFSVPFW